MLDQRSGLLDPCLVRGQVMVVERLVGLGEQGLGFVEQIGRRLVGLRWRMVVPSPSSTGVSPTTSPMGASKPGNNFANALLNELPNAALLFCDTSTNSMVGCDSLKSLTDGCTYTGRTHNRPPADRHHLQITEHHVGAFDVEQAELLRHARLGVHRVGHGEGPSSADCTSYATSEP